MSTQEKMDAVLAMVVLLLVFAVGFWCGSLIADDSVPYAYTIRSHNGANNGDYAGDCYWWTYIKESPGRVDARTKEYIGRFGIEAYKEMQRRGCK